MDANGIATVLTALATLVTAAGWAMAQWRNARKIDEVHTAATQAATAAQVINGDLPALIRKEVGTAIALHAAGEQAKQAGPARP